MPSEGPEPKNIENVNGNPSTINSEVTETTQSTPILPPHQRTTRRNSLTGLTPVNETKYGRGKYKQVTSSRASANVLEVVKGAYMLEDNGSLEPGGVELDMSEEEWFHEAMEVAMAASEDEPMLSEALNGDE